jgi:hypothetical protein
VGLVVVTAALGQVGPAGVRLAFQQADEPVEAQDPGDRLRRHADVCPELGDEVLATAA